MPVAMVSAGTLYFIHPDHLGTPQRITDANQNIVWDAALRPFGEVEQMTQTFTLNLRFPGQYADAETGLNYNFFRDYDPSVGRYVESDPIGLEGGTNTYAYVQGDPVSLADPDGLQAVPLNPVLPPPGGSVGGSPYHVEWPPGLLDWIKQNIIDPTMSMAKGGKQEKGNEYSRAAVEQARASGKDPCDLLDEWYDEATANRDTKAAMKIQTAQKALNCRNKQKRCQ
jgi:RHS repeat-associated protein